jgi:hypothetical protein
MEVRINGSREVKSGDDSLGRTGVDRIRSRSAQLSVVDWAALQTSALKLVAHASVVVTGSTVMTR